MQRTVIIVRGRVQKVGYRDLVTEIADTMDITGIVENLPDGKSVKIMAEAGKDVLDKFIELLWAKEDPMIRVLGIDVGFEPATGEYEFFDIMYGDFQQEAFERIGMAAIYLKRLDVGQDKMLDKQDSMLEKQEQNIVEIRGLRNDTIQRFDKLDTSISSFHHDTVQRFDILDEKYGRIAENIERAIDAINRTCDNTERDRKDFQDAIEKLANAIIESRRT